MQFLTYKALRCGLVLPSAASRDESVKTSHKRVKWFKSFKQFSPDLYRHSLMSENFDIQTAGWRRQNLRGQQGAEGVGESAPTWEKSDPHLVARHSGLRLHLRKHS